MSTCINWAGSVGDRGYGRIRINGKWKRAHRLSYELMVGPIPEGLHVCHACDNPLCVNPAHLFCGSHSDNMKDCVAKRRHNMSRKTHCPHGHEYSASNTYIVPISGNRLCRECDKERKRAKFAETHSAADGTNPSKGAPQWK